VGAASLAVLGLSGCESECDEAGDRAFSFMNNHQSCENDGECAIVRDPCQVIPAGSCGQLTMNRTGEQSPEWQAIEKELRECTTSDCETCGPGRLPSCVNGSCGGP
jgi:hypothetical protein